MHSVGAMQKLIAKPVKRDPANWLDMEIGGANWGAVMPMTTKSA